MAHGARDRGHASVRKADTGRPGPQACQACQAAPLPGPGDPSVPFRARSWLAPFAARGPAYRHRRHRSPGWPAGSTMGGPMPFDPQIQAIRDRLERDQVPNLYSLSVADARAAERALTQAAVKHREPVASVADRTIPGPAGELPVRVYHPGGVGAWPVLRYFLGGGGGLCTLHT